ncbi:uncharacterized protein RHOBADRAFT_66683 [Rhodotorula graminis WP1]|uniref:Uncharacterized protein n=1 Tax=Rhodotorula graminis (strain WP1) TaxID=578459 RepID=A0A0P9IVZ0_RHOGW|nr:uncharacterized protein RHOBADRAFT_66683 [Rhodotorula graminis WP1]KPV73914.1 hypothetical protein RHOBADRAFT_66683 [Rhodotorula graminis WP1]
MSKEYLAFGKKMINLTYRALAVDNIQVVVVDACGKDPQVATRTSFYGRLNCGSSSFLTRNLFGRRVHVNLREHSTIALRTRSPWLRGLIFIRDVSTILAESEDFIGPVDETLGSMTPKSVLEHLKREYREYNEFPHANRFERLIPFDDLIARIGGEPSTFAQARDRAHIVIASLSQSGRKWQIGAGSTPVKSSGPEGGSIFNLLTRRCTEESDGVPVMWASLDSTTQSSLIYYAAVDFDGPPPPGTVVSPKQLMSKYSLGIHARRVARLEAESITVKVNPHALARAENIFALQNRGDNMVRLDSLNVQLAACVTADIWHMYAGGSNETATSSDTYESRGQHKRVHGNTILLQFFRRSLPPHLHLRSVAHGEKATLLKRLRQKSTMLQPYGMSIGKYLGKNGYEMGFTNDLEGKFQGNPHQAQLARRIYEEVLGEMERNEWPCEALVNSVTPASHDVARARVMLFAAGIVQVRLPPVDPSDSSAMSVSSVGTDSTLSSVDEDEVGAAVDVERNDSPLGRWLRTRPAVTDEEEGEEEGEEDGYEGQDEGGGGTDIEHEVDDDEIADDEAEEDEAEEDEAEEDSDESWEGFVAEFSEASDEEQ